MGSKYVSAVGQILIWEKEINRLQSPSSLYTTFIRCEPFIPIHPLRVDCTTGWSYIRHDGWLYRYRIADATEAVVELSEREVSM